MKYFTVLFVALVACSQSPSGELVGSSSSAIVCGDCGAGEMQQGSCVYPAIGDFDTVDGLPPADTGSRAVYDPDDYSGSDGLRLQTAINLAELDGGAVVLGRIFETKTTPTIDSAIMITGGGIRRACTPDTTATAAAAATDTCLSVNNGANWTAGEQAHLSTGPSFSETLTTLWVQSATAGELCFYTALGVAVPNGARVSRINHLLKVIGYIGDIVVDSVLFDGANDCNGFTHDWRYNNTAVFRGRSIMRDTVFFDTPSENLTVCGARLSGVYGFDLQGSLVHKSCAVVDFDMITASYVDGANLSTDAVMQHSEGVVTLSAQSRGIATSSNVFRNGSEGVFGWAGPDDEGIVAGRDCYAHFDRVAQIVTSVGTDLSAFRFDADLVDVSTVVEEW